MESQNNDRTLNYLVGMVVATIIIPLLLKYLLSSWIEISLLEAWGIVSLTLIIFEGFNVIKRSIDEV